MAYERDSLLRRAIEGQRESRNLDFKAGFNIDSREEWCEVIKDIVAFANSGGGVILFGANDDGTSAGVDIEPYLQIDPADIANKLNAYTGCNFAEFEMVEIERNGNRLAALLIFAATTPMVFLKDGSHRGEGRERRPAFVRGSVYFRHGAKSEPGTSDDLQQWLDRSLENVRETWLGGLRQVVEARPGDQLRVVTTPGVVAGQINARIGNDPNAMVVRPQNPEEIWPYREAALIDRVVPSLPPGTVFNGHDIRCLKSAHRISPESHPQFVFKPHEMASPQYSEEFARWISDQFRADPDFLSAARRQYRANNNRY